MRRQQKLNIGLIWSQFAAYHIDRCEAVARRLAGRAQVQAIEVATTSLDYAWEASGDVAGASKVTLFPERSFDSIGWLSRYSAMRAATRNCEVVCIGLSYALPDAILLSWVLRLTGRRVIVFSESKFDDTERSIWLELAKTLVLSCYNAAIVGGARHRAYFRFLGFRRRPVVLGYDGVGTDRIRQQAGENDPAHSFAERPFVFVGRFVAKKNLVTLVEGYARYVALAGRSARRLILIGSGDEEAAVQARADELGVAPNISFPGFLGAEAVSRTLSTAAALLLVSHEEQWGLVVNEALALGIPVVVSHEVGSREALVESFVTGFVVESNSPGAIGRALHRVGSDRTEWEAMSAAATARSAMGDADRLAEALELLLLPRDESAVETEATSDASLESYK